MERCGRDVMTTAWVAGDTCKVLSTATIRCGEQLSSEYIADLPVGTQLEILTVGTKRRLQVSTVANKFGSPSAYKCVGWVSSLSQQGDVLVGRRSWRSRSIAAVPQQFVAAAPELAQPRPLTVPQQETPPAYASPASAPRPRPLTIGGFDANGTTWPQSRRAPSARQAVSRYSSRSRGIDLNAGGQMAASAEDFGQKVRPLRDCRSTSASLRRTAPEMRGARRCGSVELLPVGRPAGGAVAGGDIASETMSSRRSLSPADRCSRSPTRVTSGGSVCPFMEISAVGLANLIAALGMPAAEDCIYDVGCGKGRILDAVLRAFPRCRGVATDVNPALTRDAEKQLAKYGERVQIITGDIREMAIADATTVITHFSSNALAHVKDHFAKMLPVGCVWLTYAWQVPGWTPSWPPGQKPVSGVHRYVIGASNP